MHLRLMIPGPIELENEVREQMGAPNHAHYGDEWVAIHNETVALLARVFGTEGKVFIMPGTGSLGLDAAIHSTFAPGERVLVGVSGMFGERLREVLLANGAVVTSVEAPPGELLTAEMFARALEADPSIRAVAVVHLETSTAVVNPVREIAQVAQAHHCLVMVDAVSSLAGTDLQMDTWGIDLCVSASQKGLGGAPGLGIVAVGPRAWAKIEANAGAARSWYLDLRRWQWYVENWADWHPFPITMPTAVVLGLHCALKRLMDQGLQARFARYEQLAARLRAGLEALGMPLFVPAERMAPIITAAYVPPGTTSGEIVRFLEQKHHIKITSGFGAVKQQVIRVGHMGGAVTERDIDDLLAGLKDFVESRN